MAQGTPSGVVGWVCTTEIWCGALPYVMGAATVRAAARCFMKKLLELDFLASYDVLENECFCSGGLSLAPFDLKTSWPADPLLIPQYQPNYSASQSQHHIHLVGDGEDSSRRRASI